MEGFGEILDLLCVCNPEYVSLGGFVVFLEECSAVEAVPESYGCVFEEVGSYGGCLGLCTLAEAQIYISVSVRRIFSFSPWNNMNLNGLEMKTLKCHQVTMKAEELLYSFYYSYYPWDEWSRQA